MDFLTSLADSMTANWHVWLVTIVLIVAAVIDGIQLKVPNWLTFPMIISGWLFSIGSLCDGPANLGTSDWVGA